MHESRTISLGFTGQRFPQGAHVCQIYGDDQERQDAILSFLLTGLQAGERSACFSEALKEDLAAEYLGRHGIDLDEARAGGMLLLSGTREVYFHEGRFEPERMVGLLEAFHDDAGVRGFSGARVIGEMLPEVQALPGGSRLIEYEAMVNQMLRRHPVTAVCQYDARAFDGATILEVLKVHPYMIVRGEVVGNPFFTPPEDFLRQTGH
ncbi:hypothetical protein NNJEOMEG_00969 [Fundidesulfovibrio magnetotacticus]|uniref:MEDS domain-containing protein n=1 Tax=Fundidesulfovibrio magnetotacticus TaxID=2730080 RepID=A0A6V8LS43_9BACT|nr:MEDS domain-containing protein [Fundidesulfovibrio magnetotacticus]GFK93138.1 hypothetical protein NNJEOMEG_00969 [Fundidesulfovibrio magnetotacticus]